MSSRLIIFLLAGLLSIGSAFARVNINTASVEELQALDGIGPVRAQAIVDYRTQNGPIRKLNELGSLEHFPDSLLKSLRNKVTFGSPEKESKAKQPVVQRDGSEERENAKAMPSIRPAAPARPATPARPASASPEVVVEHRETAAPAPARPGMPAQPPVAKPAASDAQVTLQKPAAPAKPAMPAPAKPAVPAAPAKPAVPAATAASHEHEAAAHDEKPAPARPAIPAPARPAAVH